MFRYHAWMNPISHRYSQPQPPPHPPGNLDVVRFGLRRDKTVPHQEVNQDETTVRLKIAGVQGVNQFRDGEELWLSAKKPYSI